jgi:hypothetical protein
VRWHTVGGEHLVSPIEVDLAARATAAEVQPIIARSCALGGCHLSAPGAAGLVLDSRWVENVVGVPSKANPAQALVVAGNPKASWFVAKLFSPLCGTATCDRTLGCGGPMPPGEPLSAAERALIVAWVQAGAR